MNNQESQVRSLLPLPLAAFHILISLAEGQRHGYAIIQQVSARTHGELELSAGTLYRSIQRMLNQGLIREVVRRKLTGDDPRRRYYRISGFGKKVVQAEARRLRQLVQMAQASGFNLEEAQ